MLSRLNRLGQISVRGAKPRAGFEILLASTRVCGRFNLIVTAPTDIDGLSVEALQALVVQLLSKVVLSAFAPSNVSGALCSCKGVKRDEVPGMWIDDCQRTS